MLNPKYTIKDTYGDEITIEVPASGERVWLDVEVRVAVLFAPELDALIDRLVKARTLISHMERQEDLETNCKITD